MLAFSAHIVNKKSRNAMTSANLCPITKHTAQRPILGAALRAHLDLSTVFL